MAKVDAKVVWAGVKKYHFWVLTTLALILGGTVWAWAASELNEHFNSRESKLKGEFQSLEKIKHEPDHPNERKIAAYKQLLQAVKDKVRDAWVTLYAEQEEKNNEAQKNIPWPDEVRTILDDLASVKAPSEIPTSVRERYNGLIYNHFGVLLKLVDARTVEEKKAGPAPGAPMAPVEPAGAPSAANFHVEGTRGLLVWSQADFESFAKRFLWDTMPTSREVRTAQEDLLMYEALLWIIKETNRDAATHENAPVKHIEVLKLGKDAAPLWESHRQMIGRFSRPGQAGGPAQAATPRRIDLPVAGQRSDAAAKEALDDRYVNDSGQSLKASDASPYDEFKMMPIYMKLIMDQSKVPELLVQCANSNMPVEVWSMRLGLVEGGSDSTGPDATGRPAVGRPGPAGTARRADAQTTDISVELFGIITIFNAPREEPKAVAPVVAPRAGPLGTTKPAVPAAPRSGTSAPVTPLPAVPKPLPAGGAKP